MKKLCNNNREWKDEMVRRWQNVGIMYQRLREHPSFKLATIVMWGLIKLIVRVLIKKLFAFFSDYI